jgi:hypothetical protein
LEVVDEGVEGVKRWRRVALVCLLVLRMRVLLLAAVGLTAFHGSVFEAWKVGLARKVVVGFCQKTLSLLFHDGRVL